MIRPTFSVKLIMFSFSFAPDPDRPAVYRAPFHSHSMAARLSMSIEQPDTNGRSQSSAVLSQHLRKQANDLSLKVVSVDHVH